MLKEVGGKGGKSQTPHKKNEPGKREAKKRKRKNKGRGKTY